MRFLSSQGSARGVASSVLAFYRSIWVLKALLVIFLGSILVAGFLSLTIIISQFTSNAGPREVFEAHLVALDAGTLDDANALMDSTCGKLKAADVNAARTALQSVGFTFQTAFRVSEVWLNEGKTEAFLELDTPEQLPLPGSQSMIKVDGEWRLRCE